MPRALAPLALAALLATAAALPAGSAAYKVGISDQQADTFSNPLYAPLKMKFARYITPYDVMDDPASLPALTQWIAAAHAAHQEMLISFEHSHKGAKAKKAPSIAAYTKAIKKFRKAFPSVKDISPWNEVNRKIFRSGTTYQGQPIWNNPKRAAQYYMAARKVFKGRKIVALDILDQANVASAVRYVKKFRRYAKPAPKIWGVHPYSDNNRFSTKRTKALLKATGHGQVWLTESGGIVKLGSSFPFNTKRAAKAIGCTFTGAKLSKRISRVYLFQFRGSPPGSRFDSGLLNFDNSKRPGYDVVRKRKASRCHK
jgi:hypothetical protein